MPVEIFISLSLKPSFWIFIRLALVGQIILRKKDLRLANLLGYHFNKVSPKLLYK